VLQSALLKYNAKDKRTGVLMGHLEGITFIHTRGDGRYFISSGKMVFIGEFF